jgi:hypothetical protein
VLGVGAVRLLVRQPVEASLSGSARDRFAQAVVAEFVGRSVLAAGFGRVALGDRVEERPVGAGNSVVAS